MSEICSTQPFPRKGTETMQKAIALLREIDAAFNTTLSPQGDGNLK